MIKGRRPGKSHVSRIKLLDLVLFSSVRDFCGILGLSFWDNWPSEKFTGKLRRKEKEHVFLLSTELQRQRPLWVHVLSQFYERKDHS